MTYTVLPGQTLFDAALMATGTLQHLCAIAAANSLAISDDIVPGMQLRIPPGLAPAPGVLALLAAGKTTVATLGGSQATGTFTTVFDDMFN